MPLRDAGYRRAPLAAGWARGVQVPPLTRTGVRSSGPVQGRSLLKVLGSVPLQLGPKAVHGERPPAL